MFDHNQKITYPGVAQLVARLLWEQDAAGSNPVTRTNANGDTVFSNTVSPFAFLLLQANGMGGQHDLILYGDQANTELL